MQSLLADDFIAQGPAGFVLSREAWLGRYRSGEFGYESYELIDVNIREYDGFAVVNAVQNQRANYKGSITKGAFRITLVARKEGDGWRFVNAQLSGRLGQ